MSEQELKPCPFCGEDHIELVEDDQKFIVTCILCGASTDWCLNKNFIIDRWNTRADHIPDASKMMWISVDDQLPDEDDGVVVVCVNNVAQFVDVDCFEDGNWQSYMYGSITHWMPLPPPPNG